MNHQPAISVESLTKNYGDVPAVRGVDFQVAKGEVFGLLGPNGAGKTTTVEILEGIRPRTGGEVRVLGFDEKIPALEQQAERGSRLGLSIATVCVQRRFGRGAHIGATGAAG